MFSCSILRRCPTGGQRVAVGSSTSSARGGPPSLSPAVYRSLYRKLYAEVRRLDQDPLSKILFPCSKELQEVLGLAGPLYVPNSVSYRALLRRCFTEVGTTPRVGLAFEALTRLRAHRSNVQEKLPAMLREREQLVGSLQEASAAHAQHFRARPLPRNPVDGPKYVSASTKVPTRVVLRSTSSVEVAEGTMLVAHPLSSTHVDRRVMLITERTPVITSAVVLDLHFTYPLSRGNPMFPEVFWGHDVYDGGFSQIGFTMPPTAQITILHTLEPDTSSSPSHTQGSESSAPGVLSWLKWNERGAQTSSSSSVGPDPIRQHELLCKPLIRGAVGPDGQREPTLYQSKVEALPYLARLVPGQPRSSLRVYWGSMRWSTSQIETEVGNGHWIPVQTSPAFFQPYPLEPVVAGARGANFPTLAELDEARVLRERRYGADVSIPQVFPPDHILRRRENLWDEVMYAMGGEYAALVGCNNPFSGQASWSTPQILAPPLPRLSTAAGSSSSSASAEAAAAAVVAAMESRLDVEEADFDDVVLLEEEEDEEMMDLDAHPLGIVRGVGMHAPADNVAVDDAATPAAASPQAPTNTPPSSTSSSPAAEGGNEAGTTSRTPPGEH